ncbi:MAG TPA: hypothetical protein VK595_18060, partial [Vicinamibacterales bacterium]|nr:hypothetical protein [Vicinamibacterales bacterium]
ADPPGDVPERPVPMVPAGGTIELPSALDGVGELMLVEGMVDVAGGLVEVVLDNTPGVDTQGRGSIVWLIGFVVGAVGFVCVAPGVAPAGFGEV